MGYSLDWEVQWSGVLEADRSLSIGPERTHLGIITQIL